jgi:hypothetical protein
VFLREGKKRCRLPSSTSNDCNVCFVEENIISFHICLFTILLQTVAISYFSSERLRSSYYVAAAGAASVCAKSLGNNISINNIDLTLLFRMFRLIQLYSYKSRNFIVHPNLHNKKAFPNAFFLFKHHHVCVYIF